MKKYVIKKYVEANSLNEALKKEKKTAVDNIWVEEKESDKNETYAIGFEY